MTAHPTQLIKPTTEVPAQILVSDLLVILTNAKLFADKDGLVPALNAIQLESTGTYLVATGTNRFALGAAAAPYADERWTSLLPLEHVDAVLAMLKNCVGGTWVCARIERSPQGRRITFVLPLDADEDVRVSFPTRKDHEAVSFPKWRLLVKAEKVTPESPSTFSVDAQRLALFAKVKVPKYADKAMAVSVPKTNKPIKVRVGNRFIGMLAPVRAGESEDPTWL